MAGSIPGLLQLLLPEVLCLMFTTSTGVYAMIGVLQAGVAAFASRFVDDEPTCRCMRVSYRSCLNSSRADASDVAIVVTRRDDPCARPAQASATKAHQDAGNDAAAQQHKRVLCGTARGYYQPAAVLHVV